MGMMPYPFLSWQPGPSTAPASGLPGALGQCTRAHRALSQPAGVARGAAAEASCHHVLRYRVPARKQAWPEPGS